MCWTSLLYTVVHQGRLMRYILRCLVMCARFGIEGIMRTFTGEGSQGMAGQGKPPGGLPNISCRAGAAEEDGANAKNAVRGRKGRNGAKSSCIGCSVM